MSDTPTPSPVTWCAWMGPDAPPMALGRDADDALARLRSALVTFFRDEAETPSTDPEARADAELTDYRSNGLLCFMAPDEVSAFTTWVTISCLTPSEALLRWREVFPSAARVDPLVRLSARLPTPAERVRRIEAGAPLARSPLSRARQHRLPPAPRQRLTHGPVQGHRRPADHRRLTPRLRSRRLDERRDRGAACAEVGLELPREVHPLRLLQP